MRSLPFLGWILFDYKHMPMRVKNSKDLCLLAVRNNGLALQYVGKLGTEDTCEIVETALRKTPEAFPLAISVLKRIFYNDRTNQIGKKWVEKHMPKADQGQLTSVLVVLAMACSVPIQYRVVPHLETLNDT